MSPATLQAQLQESGDDRVLVKSGSRSLIVSRATACQIGDAYVLSGASSPQVQAWMDAGLLKTVACLHPPCADAVHVDVTNSDVSVRKDNPGGEAAIVIGGLLGAGLLVGLSYMAFTGIGHGLAR